MPNRILHEGILTSDAVNKLGVHAQILFYKLINVHDDYGRFDARPAIVRATCFQLCTESVREADVSRWLAEVQSAGLIALYEVDAKPFGLFLTIDRPRAKKSKHPAPPESVQSCQRLRADASTCAHMRPYSYSDSYSNAHAESGRLTAASPERARTGGRRVQAAIDRVTSVPRKETA